MLQFARMKRVTIGANTCQADMQHGESMGARVLPALGKRWLIVPAVVFIAGLVAVDASAQTRRGVVKGVVRDSLGAPVPAAAVAIVGTAKWTFTDEGGRFRLNDVPFGEVDVRVRRLGYKPQISTIVFPPGTEPEIELRIVAIPDFLPSVEVVGERQVYESRLSGFNERRTKGVGYFITRERLDHISSYRFIDILREVPGVRMRSIRGGGSTIQLRGATCSPLVFVDGSPASAGVVDLDMFDLSTVEGIEVYAGLASIPPQFITGSGAERCGVVAIWSRPYRPKAPAVTTFTGKSSKLDSLVASMTTYSMDDVDTPAALVPGTVALKYPDSLRVNGVAGRVVVELIVDVDGKLYGASVNLVSSTHPLFTIAVQEALATARFRVATLKGRPVRQFLQLPFVFRLENSASNR